MELARNESSEHTYGKVQGSDSKNASRAQAAKWKILFPSSMHEHNAGIERESILKFYAFDVQFYSIVDEKKKYSQVQHVSINLSSLENLIGNE